MSLLAASRLSSSLHFVTYKLTFRFELFASSIASCLLIVGRPPLDEPHSPARSITFFVQVEVVDTFWVGSREDSISVWFPEIAVDWSAERMGDLDLYQTSKEPDWDKRDPSIQLYT